MTVRYVTHTGKDRDGDITSLGNPSQWWSPRAKLYAIADIETGSYEYRVRWPEKETTVRVVFDRAKGKYLRTDRDSTTRNNLDDLPDC